MKKFSANYVALNYNSSIGYSLLIQDCKSVSIRATFADIESAKEYLEFKVGKVLSKGFTPYFEEIRQLIVSEPDIKREILSNFYLYSGGQFKVSF
jgi:hypothetical protein